VHIVSSTGFHKLVFYPANHWIHHIGEHRLARKFVHDIKEGMADEGRPGEPALPKGCLAGVIKVALDVDGIEGRYRVLFEAAAATARETGAAVMLHVESGADAEDLEAGDSASYRADVRHALINSGRGEAVIILVDIYP
jgi:phosphotriesterase-related protein